MSKHAKKGVDMSLPEKDRGRKRQRGLVGGTPPAQMSHASGSRAARWQRDGARKLAAMEDLHGSSARLAEPDEVPYEDSLIEDEGEMNNLLMARRSLGQDW